MKREDFLNKLHRKIHIDPEIRITVRKIDYEEIMRQRASELVNRRQYQHNTRERRQHGGYQKENRCHAQNGSKTEKGHSEAGRGC